ncbi:MAG: aminotransferase class III-fold pyridoxal phosphate-dependent enzyme [Candidatus Promineifilaceae bacterium]
MMGWEVRLSPAGIFWSERQITRAEGCYLYDETGAAVLDFSGGQGTVPLGYGHPAILAAVQQQLWQLMHDPFPLAHTAAAAALAASLASLLPESLNAFFWSATHERAWLAAVDLARQISGKPFVISVQEGAGGLADFTVPYPHPAAGGWPGRATAADSLAALERLLASDVTAGRTAAVVIEPVLSGGCVAPPLEFWRELQGLCRQHHLFLIGDERGSAWGRTGSLFAWQHTGITPDVLVWGEGLAAGLPASGLAAAADMMRAWQPAVPFSLNPLAAAAATATLDMLRQDDLLANAAARGEQLRSALRAWQAHSPFLGEVHGQGVMVGLEMGVPARGPDGYLAARVQEECLTRALWLPTAGSDNHVLCWNPPLTVTVAQIDEALAIFAESLEEVFDT